MATPPVFAVSGAPNVPNYPNTLYGGAVVLNHILGGICASTTTSAQTNSTSITLSYAFTALTFTQTSTGNTVNLPASPVHGQLCGFSISNNVTNLTVSSAANTVANGAATSTTSAGKAMWWQYDLPSTTWYPFSGGPLSS